MAAQTATSRSAIIAAAVLLGTTALATPAQADDVSSTGKGIAGGALLGAEAVTIVEGLADVRPAWAYVVGGIAGAAGGAVGGYFVEHGDFDGHAPTYLLAGGLALVIPAIVLTLNATRYRPEDGATEDRVPVGPAAEPGAPGAGIVVAPAPPSPPPPPPPAVAPAPPQSLLDLHQGAFRMGVPVPDVRPVFSVAQQRQYGMRGETELRVPVLHVTF